MPKTHKDEAYERIAIKCREILDTEEPFYWNYNLSEREKDFTIDLLLRTILGLTEIESSKYAEDKFNGAFKKIKQ